MRRFLLFALFSLTIGGVWAYDFSGVTPSGHTLYYNIIGDGVIITYQSFNPPAYNSMAGDLIIPDTVTHNGISYPVTTIGMYTFRGCEGLRSVVIPNTVVEIKSLAFSNCTGLQSISIGQSLSVFDHDAFNGCISLVALTVADSNDKYDSRDSCNAIIETATNTLVFGLKSTVIPNSVVAIGENAFNGRQGLTSIVILDSVTSIGSTSFANCTDLESVVIPPSVTDIGFAAFMDCYNLPSITVPDSVTFINNWAFYNVRMVYYNGSATGSPWMAQCVNGYIDDSLYYTSPTKDTLTGCHPALHTAIIPDSVTTINNSAFSRSERLDSIYVPMTVQNFGTNLFAWSEALRRVMFESVTPPTISRNTLNGAADSMFVVVPNCDAQDNYRNAQFWSQFSNIIGIFDYSVALSADSTKGSAKIIRRPTCDDNHACISAIPNTGYRFVSWSDGDTNRERCLEVTADTSLVAMFSNVGVPDVQIGKLSVSVTPAGDISVSGAIGLPLSLFDIMGRNLYSSNASSENIVIHTPSTGIYLLKVGMHPVIKVPVVK